MHPGTVGAIAQILFENKDRKKSMEQKEHNTINDIINELKRLQIEHGNVAVARFEEYAVDDNLEPAWPAFNEKQNRVEF